MKLGRSWGQLGMKSEWNIGTISEVCSLVTDGSHYSPKSCDNGEYMVSVKDFKGFGFDFSNCKHISSSDYEKMKASGCIPECGDILIGKDGARFFEDIIIYNQPEKPALLSSIAILRCNPDIILPQFLYYICKNPVFKKDVRDNYGSGSAIPRIVLKDFKRMPISYPDLDEQRKIVASLVAIDDRILLNTAINENLESQAQAIFKAWFVDFEPFDGVMPEDWKIGMIKDIIELHDSKRIPLSGSEREKMDKIYPYYGATSCMDYVDNYIFDGKYLLLGEDGTVIDKNGYPILQYVEGKFWVNNHAHIITGKFGYTVEILYLLFKQTNVKHIVTGAVQPKISQANLKKVPVTISSIKDLDAFNNIIQPIFAMIRKNRNENEKLALLRDTLLPKLMNGEIDVSEVKI